MYNQVICRCYGKDEAKAKQAHMLLNRTLYTDCWEVISFQKLGSKLSKACLLFLLNTVLLNSTFNAELVTQKPTVLLFLRK